MFDEIIRIFQNKAIVIRIIKPTFTCDLKTQFEEAVL